MFSLPPDWSWQTLDDTADVILGQSPPGSSYNTDGLGVPFFQGKAEFGDMKPTVVKWTTDPKRLAETGDVLLSVRAPVGPTNVAPFDCCVGRGLAALRAGPTLAPGYLLYWMRASADELASAGTGTTFKAVSGKQVRSHPIPVPPIDEQRRIVEAIETHLSHLDAGVESLESADGKVKHLRASVLKAAIEGKLVTQDRVAEAKANSVGLEAAKLHIDDFDIPDGWKNLSLESISDRIVDCEHSTARFEANGVACLDTNSMTADRIVREKLRYVSEETYQHRIGRMEPESGDVVFAREGTIGTAVVVPDDLRLCLGQRVMIFRPKSEVLSEYLRHAMESPIVRRQYVGKITGTTSPHLNIRDIKPLAIPVPPLSEQRRIVEEVSRQLSIVDALASQLKSGAIRSGGLRRSVLRAAFSGELVPRQRSGGGRDSP